MYQSKRNHLSQENRAVCYTCYRPQSSCMCEHITPIDTKTRFIILMHPKEFKKTKNGTGHFTHLSLKNSQIYVGIDFTQHAIINALIHDENNNCYILYPSDESINLNEESIDKAGKNNIIFLIDATWPCSRAMLRESPNLDALTKISFTHQKSSNFHFKKQPESYCLSTMESTLCVLELLTSHQDEDIGTYALEHFLAPFQKMVEYQLSYNL